MIGAKHPPSPRAINSIRRLVSPMQPSLPPLPLCGAARPWSFSVFAWQAGIGRHDG